MEAAYPLIYGYSAPFEKKKGGSDELPTVEFGITRDIIPGNKNSPKIYIKPCAHVKRALRHMIHS